MNKEKVGEAPYLLLYINAYEKSNFIFDFLYSLAGKEKLKGEDKKALADIYVLAKILTKEQAAILRDFKKNRNNIAHKLWKIKVEYKTDYLKLGESLKALKEFFDHNKQLIDQYNSEVEEERKIYPHKLFDSIKQDAYMLLDENDYPEIFSQLKEENL